MISYDLTARKLSALNRILKSIKKPSPLLMFHVNKPFEPERSGKLNNTWLLSEEWGVSSGQGRI